MISGLWEKLGFWSQKLIKEWESKKNWKWFHAVSVGEFNSIVPLIEEISNKKPESPIMVSCTTKAAYNLAKDKSKGRFKTYLNQNILVFYFPFDLPHIINSLLNHAKVKILIIAETELWPNTIKICKKKNTPVILVNARISDKSFKNYYFLKFYFRDVINSIAEILTQSENDATKFKKLGAEERKVKIFGNLKFAQRQSIRDNKRENNGKPLKQTDSTTIIFASTHKGEETLAINLYKKLLTDFLDLRLIIAPRHLNRVEEITNMIKQNDLTPLLKTKNIQINSNNEVLVLDTIGELEKYLEVSDITVMGGTFAKIGGHNILEPIRANSYTIIGPYDFKILELSKPFKNRNAIVQVKDLNELESKITEAIKNKNLREKAIQIGKNIINENESVLENTTKQILSYL